MKSVSCKEKYIGSYYRPLLFDPRLSHFTSNNHIHTRGAQSWNFNTRGKMKKTHLSGKSPKFWFFFLWKYHFSLYFLVTTVASRSTSVCERTRVSGALRSAAVGTRNARGVMGPRVRPQSQILSKRVRGQSVPGVSEWTQSAPFGGSSVFFVFLVNISSTALRGLVEGTSWKRPVAPVGRRSSLIDYADRPYHYLSSVSGPRPL